MKKLIAVIMILAMILPAVVLADGQPFLGSWIHTETTTSGTPQILAVFLAENGRCYFLAQSFHEDEAGIGRTFVGTWELQTDGSVLAKTGNNTDTLLMFSGDYTVALNLKTYDFYAHVSQLIDPLMDQLLEAIPDE